MANQTVKSIGDYIREQREQARISMRQLAQSAGVSNPYLSQIERGLRKPSADILQQLAKGLRISAEALYVQAGILEDRPADSGVRSALLADSDLSERQKQVLIEIYESFRKENAAATEARAAQADTDTAQAETDTAQAETDTAQAETDTAQAEAEAAASEAAQAAAEAAAIARASVTKSSTAKASTAKASTAKASTTKASATKARAMKASTTKASTAKASATKASAEAADDDRPSRSSWAAATAEAEQDEPSGDADGVPGANGPSD
jgi:transcriptional regulator with XRE-family HTH domain